MYQENPDNTVDQKKAYRQAPNRQAPTDKHLVLKCETKNNTDRIIIEQRPYNSVVLRTVDIMQI